MKDEIIKYLTEARKLLLPLVFDYGAKIELNMEFNSLIRFVKNLPEKQNATTQ